MKKLVPLCMAFLLLAGCTAKNAVESVPPAATTQAPTVRPIVQETQPPSAPVETPVPTVVPVASPSPSPVAVGWDGRVETLTLADFPTERSDGAAVAAGTGAAEGAGSVYLLAELPEQATWLYGYYGPAKEQGLVLRLEEQWKYFEILFFTPRAILPQMAYGDYDGDLDLELGILCYADSGTEVSIWSLYMVEFKEGGTWGVRRFNPEDYSAILNETVLYQYDVALNTVTISSGESGLAFDLAAVPGLTDAGGYVGPVPFGSNVEFTLSGDVITARFVAEARFDGFPTRGVPLAMVNADVVYTGSAFGLGNLTLLPYE